MTATCRAGVIGLGILGSQYATLLHKRADITLAAVADLREETAQATAASTGATAYTAYEEMLKAEHLDLVVVATPDPLHLAPSLAAIKVGVPAIIQEKPFATKLEDATKLYEAIEKSGCKFYVNYANRATPLDIATRYVAQQGLLGDVVYGESRLDDNISVPTQLWGNRSKDWAAGSSTAHFLLSHVVDLLRFYFSPAEVTDVYAIKQELVLGYTPDLYDAYLTFDTGMKIRVKAEWIKHIDELVEFYMCFSGAKGTLIYNKRGGFGTQPGWRANLSTEITFEELLAHQKALLGWDVHLKAMMNQPEPSTGILSTENQAGVPALEYNGLGYGEFMAMPDHLIDGILQGTNEPTSWQGLGSLPNHEDGLIQTCITCAIIESADKGEPSSLG